MFQSLETNGFTVLSFFLPVNVPVYVIAFGTRSIMTFCIKNAAKVVINYDNYDL